MAPKDTPIGLWESPVTSELIVSKTLGLGAPSLLPDGTVTWTEARPSEGGRTVVAARLPDGSVVDITPPPASGLNVRTRVHEYGGGEHLALGDGRLVFSNFSDQRAYLQPLAPGAPAAPLTPAGAGLRFADYRADPARGRVVAVCEDHSDASREARNYLAAIDLATGAVSTLAEGADFYAGPALSPGGAALAWIEWDHPSMPWDATRLVVAELAADGSLVDKSVVAGGPGESVQQPRWDAEGGLYFVSDRTDWWNLYRLDPPSGAVTAVLPMAAEFGLPPWTLGLRTYAPLPRAQSRGQSGGQSRRLVLAAFNDPKAAGSQLGLIDAGGQSGGRLLGCLDCGLSAARGGWGVRVGPGPGGGGLAVVVAAGSPTRAQAIMMLQVESVEALLASGPGDWVTLKASSDVQLDPGYLSAPRAIQFETAGGATSHMNFYPPASRDCRHLPGQLPPLLVKIHGGPTSAASSLLNWSYQCWTSRGFAIADVNYGGSTGFGRKYRERLKGQWGVVDVDDCCAAARHPAAEGLVDPRRLTIDGGSAGGYTTLAALAFRDVFHAGTSLYGVADAELLAKHTHKFESRYLDGLIGPYPQAKALYEERSPIHSADKISAPCILFQGDEDEVVPPEQAVAMHAALLARGLPTALVLFKGEQHGFRGAGAIRAALEGQLYFYGKVLGFPSSYPPDLQPIHIDNLQPSVA
ncbi:peptidase [Raphidocelis subcapitata]|uniref:Peptidase n=1 Tax=Raphidocelis subcapitata TaxID=307507 RepID=A0A2V0PGW1_9CHLO|nr:peptidase [Raphidocelis subcapitata]|eukprot:GBF99098.1 peptidase [Raphidocelis subcapitata]